VKHRLGDPLVGEVFQQRIQECDRRIGWNHRSPSVTLFQLANQRSGIDTGLAVGIGKDQLRQKLDPWFRQLAAFRRTVVNPHVRDAPVAQYGTHLAAVGRADRTHDLKRSFGRHTGSSKADRRKLKPESGLIV
jgi:hypothetical protein